MPLSQELQVLFEDIEKSIKNNDFQQVKGTWKVKLTQSGIYYKRNQRNCERPTIGWLKNGILQVKWRGFIAKKYLPKKARTESVRAFFDRTQRIINNFI